MDHTISLWKTPSLLRKNSDPYYLFQGFKWSGSPTLSLSSLFPLTISLQPLWPPCCYLNRTSMYHLEGSSPDIQKAHFFHVSAQMLFLLTNLYKTPNHQRLQHSMSFNTHRNISFFPLFLPLALCRDYRDSFHHEQSINQSINTCLLSIFFV